MWKLTECSSFDLPFMPDGRQVRLGGWCIQEGFLNSPLNLCIHIEER